MGKQSNSKLDKVVAAARHTRDQREAGYRGQALKMYPHLCGRCAREFGRGNLHELTVHHRDHNHDNNPPDGSNWELLCLYCHDNEHRLQIEAERDGATASEKKPPENNNSAATFSPFAGLQSLIDSKK